MNKTRPCAIVGDGRMATHFARYLQLSGIPYKQWSRKANSEDPSDYLKNSRAVFLLIRDDAIASFAEENPGLKEMPLIHFSGSLFLEGIPSIHPLMTFSKELYSLEKYRTIPFIHEKGKMSLRDVLPELPNPVQAMDFRMKSLYHSLCVLSGNFTTMLWQKAFSDFDEKLELDDRLLIPYMEQTFENLKSNWTDALTGPLARRDKETVERNLQALEGDLYQNVYRSFASTVFTGGNL
ncbi:DUF2520 domain-containing protein [Spirochaeta isovalerica]|uniref:DUF2520 domain-containing protein n=1 Tax=Spirochaeta isovalerica TaxID=150 RepID=A0A841RBP6_9SPIO|nr:DUF2520 domain-containing protein [Spirochaeta isovalerica]MBB6479832.1 hypothetical protein [Spirochaeta isovalerica]